MSSQDNSVEKRPVPLAARAEVVQFLNSRLQKLCFNPELPLLRESILKVEEHACSSSTTRHEYLVLISNAIKVAEKAVDDHNDIDVAQTDPIAKAVIKRALASIDAAFNLTPHQTYKAGIDASVGDADPLIDLDIGFLEQPSGLPRSCENTVDFLPFKDQAESHGQFVNNELLLSKDDNQDNSDSPKEKIVQSAILPGEEVEKGLVNLPLSRTVKS